jgi:hypothetical protein
MFGSLRALGPVALLALSGSDASKDVRSKQPSHQRSDHTSADTRTLPSQSLLDTLRHILRRRNPAIEHVAFPQIQWFDYGRRYVAIGWGIRPDRRFSGSFDDELYGVFVLDSTLTGVRHVLDVLPTPRWLDYRFRIEALTGDSIIVTGRGDTYGDGPTRRAYAWPSTR